jgi:GNAT superfamily N-acetyltransferase
VAPHYVRAVPVVRTARQDELAQLPALESASDTLFLSLEIGPLPPPDSVEALGAARVVLVAGDPPIGFVRVDDVGGEAHLEQLAVHPDHGRQGIGRALVQAACRWAAAAGYAEITLATYRDVPWNGPFYASAGFVERGSADAWCIARGLPLEQPVMARFGTRVIMSRPL